VNTNKPIKKGKKGHFVRKDKKRKHRDKTSVNNLPQEPLP
jgi:hypothetical protein